MPPPLRIFVQFIFYNKDIGWNAEGMSLLSRVVYYTDPLVDRQLGWDTGGSLMNKVFFPLSTSY